jgi:hypothetical protein
MRTALEAAEREIIATAINAELMQAERPIVVRGPNYICRIEHRNGVLLIRVKSWRAK